MQHFTTRKNVGLRIQGNTVEATMNGASLLSKTFNQDLGKLVRLQLDFRGSAAVDNVKIYENNVLKIQENFDTPGQTTAQLITRTGYALTGNTQTGNTVTTGVYTMPDPSLYFSGYGPATDG